MKTLFYHILDIVQNSINAGASLVEISFEENVRKDTWTIKITDNGKGMDENTLRKATDPCFSTRSERSVGLGLSLFKQNAWRTGGSFHIWSRPAKGTTVQAVFLKNHIDCPALGDLAGTIHQILVSNSSREFVYRHHTNGSGFVIDTREIRKVLDGLPLYHPEISRYIGEMIRENLEQVI